ncbi:MAG: 4Fe-4S dicluster domain-containing protein [Deltaproteobacteria bacterium]|nr:4Fe-4S dicluster domain-containing protein [Deltaproteobacteria bacterium]
MNDSLAVTTETELPPVAGRGEALIPSSPVARELTGAPGESLAACYGCRKCSGGCPLTFAMDLLPHQVVRLALLGQREALLTSRTIWLCASCQTCLTRCPNQVDLPGLMDHLRALAIKEGVPPALPRVLQFHQCFLGEVRARGRVWEASLMGRYLLATGGWRGPEARDNARLGWELFRRGRLALLPHGVRGRGWLRELFQNRPGESS